jgi:hypothetical protein
MGMILMDRVSNRIKTKLVSGGRYDDPEVRKLLDAYKAPPPKQPSPLPGKTLPTYLKRPGSPEVPKDAGVALSVERVIVLRPESRAVLHGSFRLPVLKHEFTERNPVTPNPKTLDDDRSGARPSAIVPITLVVTRSVSPGTVVATIAASTYDRVEPGDHAPLATGHFALDLFTLPGMEREEETCFIYVLCGDYFSGPTKVAFVTEESVRGGR